MTRWLAGLILVLLLAGQALAGSSGRVNWIYDGDTLRVEGIGKVRLIGIDAPEHEDSYRDRFYRRWGITPGRLRAIAAENLRFQIDTVKGQVVTLSFDRERTDKYGRTLAYVTLPDGRMLNRLLLEKGYATVFRRYDFRLKQDFLAAEEKARRAKVGLWER